MVKQQQQIGSQEEYQQARTARQQDSQPIRHAIHRGPGSQSKDIHVQDELNKIHNGSNPARRHNNTWNGLHNHRGNSTFDKRRYPDLDVVPKHTSYIFGNTSIRRSKKKKTRSRTVDRDQKSSGPSSRTIQPSTFGSLTARPAKRN